MSKRINIILPDATLALLDRVVPRRYRSRFVDNAVLRMVKTEGAVNLREQLKAGALANSDLNLEIAEEWLPAEQEAWQKLDREERAPLKATRKEAKSTSQRSIRR